MAVLATWGFIIVGVSAYFGIYYKTKNTALHAQIKYLKNRISHIEKENKEVKSKLKEIEDKSKDWSDY